MSFAQPRPLTAPEYAQLAFCWVLRQYELHVNTDDVEVTPQPSQGNTYEISYLDRHTQCSAFGTYVGNESGGTTLLIGAKTPCGAHLYNKEDYFLGIDASGTPKQIAPRPLLRA